MKLKREIDPVTMFVVALLGAGAILGVHWLFFDLDDAAHSNAFSYFWGQLVMLWLLRDRSNARQEMGA